MVILIQLKYFYPFLHVVLESMNKRSWKIIYPLPQALFSVWKVWKTRDILFLTKNASFTKNILHRAFGIVFSSEKDIFSDLASRNDFAWVTKRMMRYLFVKNSFLMIVRFSYFFVFFGLERQKFEWKSHIFRSVAHAL